jgi:hypothetical protein
VEEEDAFTVATGRTRGKREEGEKKKITKNGNSLA